MLESIATALIKTLVSYLFSSYFDSYSGIDIDGAPYWYGREEKSEICVSVSQRGDIDRLKLTKSYSKLELQRRIENIIKIIAYKNFKNLKPDEKKFLERVENDKNLPLFVDANAKIKNIKVDNDENRIFVRSCIDKKTLLNYEKERIKTIQKKLTYYRADKAFNELDGKRKFNSFDEEDKAFKELQNETKKFEK